MADIRIKDLATTAASTASDDFIAVDGSANGTRKLSAYSPTFGGNVTANGNLTVSGTGDGITIAPTAGVANLVINGAAAGSTINFAQSGTNKYTLEYVSASNFWSIGRSGVAYDLVLKSGNLLLGTTTDSSNGKLQLATHTTSAGGIGFGTDTSLYRDGIGYVSLYGPNADTTFRLWGGATQLFRITNSSTISYVQNLTGSLQLASNGTTALTLDSSQNATFAATVTAPNFRMETSGGSYRVNAEDGFVSVDAGGYARLGLIKKSGAVPSLVHGSGNSFVIARSSGATITPASNTFTDELTIDTSGNATFAGSIAIGNTVNTVSPTSPNRTITMVIGGTTYYIHAKTTND